MNVSAPALEGAELLKLLSVTSTLRVALQEGPGLVWWKLGLAAETAVDAHDLLGAMLRRDDRPGAVEYVKKAADRHARSAADRGTRVHAALEAVALGEAPVLDHEISPFVEQWGRWVERFQPEFVMAEAPVYNAAEGYAGTCDGALVLPHLGETPVAFDYKTTEHPPTKENRPPFPEAALQMCAYSRCTEVGLLAEQRYYAGRRYYLYDPTAVHQPMPRVRHDVALAIVISPYDCRAIETRIDEQVWEAWQHVQAIARFQLGSARELFGMTLEARPPAVFATDPDDDNPLLLKEESE